MRSDAEVEVLLSTGVRVLSRRHIEAYLLDDDVIRALCIEQGQPDQVHEALKIKQDELSASVSRGNDSDDYKSAAGSIYTRLRRLLKLTSAGSDWVAFARDTLAPLLKPGMPVYTELRKDVFDV